MKRAWTMAITALSLVAARPALAVGTLSGGADVPLEQRVALAVGPDRTTLWTSVRVDAAGGPVGIIAPALPGAALDWGATAWFEALEVATAPRIVAPALDCRGTPPVSGVDVVGETEHEAPLAGGGVDVLADADAVAAWAEANGLALPPALSDALAALPGQRFVAARFDAPPGLALTPTLRIVSPSPAPELPLVLTRAGDEELLVTTWVIGAGRAHLDGAPVAAISLADLSFRAATGESTYDEARARALDAAGPGAALVEAASHSALAGTSLFDDGAVSVVGVADTYFERAASYGEGLANAALCITQATNTIGLAAPVAASCPRTALGVVEGTDTCAETVGAGETDPDSLRCGPGADDLAVALSGQSPAAAWLTRQSLIVPAGGGGADVGVSLPGGAEVSPVLASRTLVCQVPVRHLDSSGCSCGSSEDTVVGIIDFFVVEDDPEEPPDSYYQDEDCSGDTTETTETNPEEGGCNGDSSNGSGGSGASSDDGGGCDGDSSDGSGGGGGASSGSSSTSDSTSDGSGGDSESGDSGCNCGSPESSGGSSGSGGTSMDGARQQNGCAIVAPRRRAGRVRITGFALGAVLLLVPLRRALRPRRRRR